MLPEFPWDVVIVSHMLPSHSDISEFEETFLLKSLIKLHDGVRKQPQDVDIMRIVRTGISYHAGIGASATTPSNKQLPSSDPRRHVLPGGLMF